jgi:hypothetical protein
MSATAASMPAQLVRPLSHHGGRCIVSLHPPVRLLVSLVHPSSLPVVNYVVELPALHDTLTCSTATFPRSFSYPPPFSLESPPLGRPQASGSYTPPSQCPAPCTHWPWLRSAVVAPGLCLCRSPHLPIRPRHTLTAQTCYGLGQ